MLTRRSILQYTAATAAYGAIGCASSRRRIARPAPIAGVTDLFIDRTPIRLAGRRGNAITLDGTVPGPLLRFREGDEVTIRVTNALDETTSIHWHGLIVPADMDGVPGLSFDGIHAGTTFTYRFKLVQYGTYWYHSHSAFQEQMGVYAPLIIDPAGGDPIASDREHVIMLSDWTFEDPHEVFENLKKYPGYYNYQRRTVGDFVRDARRRGLWATVKDRWDWASMRMDPTDIADVTSATLYYLLNGRVSSSPWSGWFAPGERVRLRIINAAAQTVFDLRIPGLTMEVVQADGQDVRPVVVEELRLGPAETYDVIVTPRDQVAYAIVAETMDRRGYAAGMLAQRAGATVALPPHRERPLRTMADMGHGHGAMNGHGQGAMTGHGHAGHAGATQAHGRRHDELAPPGTIPTPTPHGPDNHGPGNAAVPMVTRSKLDQPGTGLGNDGRRVLVYRDLIAVTPHDDHRAPSREIELHLTGHMDRFIWSIDGKKLSEADPIHVRLGERVRFTLVNDTMMEHPMHLHGMWMVLENGRDDHIPRKHTIIVKPAERLSYLVTADNPGRWAFHCHMLYHMEAGMFRVIEVMA